MLPRQRKSRSGRACHAGGGGARAILVGVRAVAISISVAVPIFCATRGATAIEGAIEFVVRPDRAALDAFAGEGAFVDRREQLERAARIVAAGERALREAAAALPDSAAPKFLLARLLAGAGRIPEARDLYRSALAVDGSYRTAYACGGFWCLNSDRPERAEREFLDSLVLEPVDGYAELGLARIAEIRRDWFAAEAWVSKALSRNPHLVDAHRMHGRLLERQRRWQDACAAYRQSLKLALHGRSPLRQPIAARRPPNQLVADVEHGRTYHRVAVLEARAGRPDAAIAAFRVGLAVDPSPPWAHARFAWLCLRRRQWTRAWRQLIAAVRAAPMSIRRTLRRGFRRSVRRLTAWRWHQGTGLVAIDYR